MDLRDQLNRLHGASFGWAMACCRGDRRDAEDVLQTVYLKILDGRARFDGRSAFRTWLFSVIRRTAAAARRERWSRALLLARWLPSAEPGPDTESVSAESEMSTRLKRAIDGLSRRQQEVLHLVFFQGLTIEETARTLGVSLGSARTHFARGKARLRLLLAEAATA